MRKKSLLVCTAITVAFLTAACGSGSVNSEFMNKLEAQAQHNISYIEEQQTTDKISIEASVDGSEKETIVKVLLNANIMNKPSDDGTVVGVVKKDENVLVIGLKQVGGWYKVAYNGRVCYVKGTNIDTKDLVVDNDNNNNNNNNRPTSTTASSTSSTPSSSEQQTTSSGDGNTSTTVNDQNSSLTTPSGEIGGENSSQQTTIAGEGQVTTPSESTSSSVVLPEPNSSSGIITPSQTETIPSDQETTSNTETTPSETSSQIEQSTSSTETPLPTSSEIDTTTGQNVEPIIPTEQETTTPQKPWYSDFGPWMN